MRKQFIGLNAKAQTAIEYMLLLAAVVTIVLIGFKRYLPSFQAASNYYKKISTFYNKKDFEAGYIAGKDRKGNEEKFGLLAISIGIVSNTSHEITHVAQISEIAAELKKYAKSIDGSNFVRDKRQN